VPLPALVFSGMEHTLHALLALLWLLAATEVLAQARAPGARLLALTALLVATRYEGLFLVLPAAILMFRRRGLSAGLRLLSAGLLPVFAYAAFSTAQGGAWLPASILLKGKGLALDSPLDWWHSVWWPLRAHLRSPLSPFVLHMLLLVPATLLAWLARRRAGFWESGRLGLALLIPALVLQLVFAGTGWFFRYEAWLVALGVFLLFGELPAPSWRFRAWNPSLERVLLAMILTGLLLALGARGWVALRRVPTASRNIHGQQEQMALFLREHYAGKAVVANDVGLITYLGGVRCVDLMGLGDREVARARRKGRLDAAFIAGLAERRGARVAVIYEEHFEGLLPAGWQKVGEWTIPDNVVCARDRVAFFALRPEEAPTLRARLAAFAPRLPNGVRSRLAGD